MSRIISASIDLNKIEISKVTTGKNGGKYVNISIIINDSVDQYGNDTSITIGQTKEEREEGNKHLKIEMDKFFKENENKINK